MDPGTIEAFQVIGKLGLIIGGGCALTLATIWGSCATALHYWRRKDRRDELMALYKEGKITTKPNIFNVYRLRAPATKPPC